MTATITLAEAQTIRHLVKITGLRNLTLSDDEIRTLVPKQSRVKIFSEGKLALHNYQVWIKDPQRPRTRVSIELEEYYPMQTPSDDSPMADHHFQHLLSLLEDTFGFDWIIMRLVEELASKYDALSSGQAEAVVQKFIPRARPDGSTLTSTARSQLHRIREKIQRYRILIDAFDPLLNREGESLEDIASSMPQQFVHGQGPYITSKGLIQTDSAIMGDIVRQAAATSPEEKAPEGIDHGEKEEIQTMRQRALAQGLDPDASETVLEGEGPLAGYRFACSYCDHTEDYETDDQGKIIPKKHHGFPMFLRMPRSLSDY